MKETTPHNSQQLPLPKFNKVELAKDIRGFIFHSRQIILNSPCGSYRNPRILASLQMAEELSKMVKEPEGVSMKDICQYTLMIKKNLNDILPSVNNKSFESSSQKLNQIITTCQSYLNIQFPS